MIKKTETIQVRLTNYGTIEVVSIPTRIYKDSYNVMRLSCIVPKVEETGARICKVYATDVDEAGNTIFTSQAHFLPQLREKDGSEKIIKINGFDYIIYEDRLPEEFCKDTGNITLNFAEGIIDGENEIVRNNVSGQLNLFISGDGYNYNGVKISNYDVVASRIDAIYKTSENALKVAEEAKDAVVQGEGTKVTLNGELLPIWSADFVESEKQKSVTDGAIVHKNEEPIVFAESERQKSKNLFDISKLNSVVNNFEVNITNGTIKLEDNKGCCGPSNNLLKEFASLKVGKTYTLSFNKTNVNANDWFYLPQVGMQWRNKTSLLITEEILNSKIAFYGTENGTNTISNIMIRDSADTDSTYQPYNGAIVHEKDIADVEHIETIYDKSSSDSNINKGYTSGIVSNANADIGGFSNLRSSDKLRIYYRFWEFLLMSEMDVKNAISSNDQQTLLPVLQQNENKNEQYNGVVQIIDNSSISFKKVVMVKNGTSISDMTGDTNFIITKIERIM